MFSRRLIFLLYFVNLNFEKVILHENPIVPQTTAPIPNVPTIKTPPAEPVTHVPTPTAEMTAPSSATVCIPVETTTPLLTSTIQVTTTTALPLTTTPTPTTTKPRTSNTSSAPPKKITPTTESPSESDNLEPTTEPSAPAEADAVGSHDVNSEVEDINPDMRLRDKQSKDSNSKDNRIITNDRKIIYNNGMQLFQKNYNNVCSLGNGFIGRCLPVENCHSINYQIRQGTSVITVCHFRNNHQLWVCCPSQFENIVTPDQQSSYPNSLNMNPYPAPIVPQTTAPIPRVPNIETPPAEPVTQAPTPTAEITAPSTVTVCMPVETTTPLSTTTTQVTTTTALPSTTTPTPTTTKPRTSNTSSDPPKEEIPTTESPSESDNLEPTTEPPAPAEADAVGSDDVNSEVEDINPDMRLTDKQSKDSNSKDNRIITNDVEIIHKDGMQLFQKKCDDYYMTKAGKLQVFVIGGTNSDPKEFPHMAALGFGEETDKKWLCGGSLVSENYVLTAAHCVSPSSVGDVKFVRLGTTNLQNVSNTVQDYNVIKRIQHPDFNGEDQYNDIALLQLDRSVQFSDYVLPICLHSLTDLDHHTLIATGWGKTDLLGGGTPDLKKVGLELFSSDECRESYKSASQKSLPRGIDEETQICAGSKKEQKDTCQGDSGGPLQFRTKGRLYLVGITSFGIGCGTPGSPGVYTRVSDYISWIEGTIWNQK